MARVVNIATCSVTFDAPKGWRDHALALVGEAGQRGADIVCIPEFAGAPTRDHKPDAQPIPGTVLDPFAALARQHEMYVIVPLVEAATDGGLPFNTAVLLDRRGQIAGRYRKTHVCLPGAGEGETTRAGDEVPVFKTDFGTIGITICMDIHYPELYAAMALQGAEVIFWPTASLDYTGDLLESLVNARAIDNQAYFVASHFVQLPYLAGKTYGRSRIVDCMGRIRADTGHFPGVAVARVDLDETYPMWYTGKMLEMYPNMRETFFKTRRPELYQRLTESLRPKHWQRRD